MAYMNMNAEQVNMHNRLMLQTPMSEWPETLKELFGIYQKHCGFSGEVMAECAAMWVKINTDSLNDNSADRNTGV